MTKDIKYFGIDISHLVFDVTDSDGNYYQFKNRISGFKKFVKLLTIDSHCVMEATGYYHYQLAYYLCAVLTPVNTTKLVGKFMNA